MVVGEPLNPHLRQRIFFSLNSIRTFGYGQIMVVGEPLNPHLRQSNAFFWKSTRISVS